MFEDDQVVWRALNDYIKAQPVRVSGKKKSADFQDALVVNKAKACIKDWEEHLDAVYSFDVAAQEIEGVFKP